MTRQVRVELRPISCKLQPNDLDASHAIMYSDNWDWSHQRLIPKASDALAVWGKKEPIILIVHYPDDEGPTYG